MLLACWSVLACGVVSMLACCECVVSVLEYVSVVLVCWERIVSMLEHVVSVLECVRSMFLACCGVLRVWF